MFHVLQVAEFKSYLRLQTSYANVAINRNMVLFRLRSTSGDVQIHLLSVLNKC
jgi:hypothetical protein